MKKLKKPTYKDRQMLLEQIMVERQCLKRDAYALLAESCGDSVGAVEKRFRSPGTPNYRDCPPSVWRSWCIDFRGFDPRYEAVGKPIGGSIC